jgi:hypothetical protein
MRTGVAAVAGGTTQPGWVSGDIAALAAAGTATIVFDLGPNWDQYNVVQLAVVPAGPSSGLSGVAVYSSDDTNFNAAVDPQLNYTWATAVGAASMAIAAPQSAMFTPQSRYMIVRATNADGANAQGAGAFMQLSMHSVI